MRASFGRLRIGNAKVFFSRLGYHQARNGSFEKRINRGDLFPRFHAYIEEEGENVVISLHIDAKRPSYTGTSAHAGEYEGFLVEKEFARITKALLPATPASPS